MNVTKEYMPGDSPTAERKSKELKAADSFRPYCVTVEAWAFFKEHPDVFNKKAKDVYLDYINGVITEDEKDKNINQILSEKPLDKEQI